MYSQVNTADIQLPTDRISYVDTDNAPEIYLDEVVFPLLGKKKIAGIEGISELYFNKDGDKWMIETNGSNFQELLSLPFVDMKRTITTNLWDIYNILGIEAARQFLIDEFLSVMEGINIAHPTLLADKMTFTGTILSISRYSMRHEERAVCQQMSFEETLDNLLNACAFGKKEDIKGVSSSIICGKRSQIGSGLCDVKMDINAILKGSFTDKNTMSYYDDEMIPTDSDSDME